jgi:hypothetical protein
MTKSGVCPLCGVRRAKRECPGTGRTICPVCCGTKRQVEIDCPLSCAYLTSARQHPPSVVQRRQERDLRFFLPFVSELTEAQFKLFLFLQSALLKHAGTADPAPNDHDVAEAAGAVAATLETAQKGVIYEHQPPGIPARHVAAELRRAFAEVVHGQGVSGRLERDAAVVLRRLEQGAKTAAEGLAGDEPPVFLNLLSRLMLARAAGREEAAEPGPSPLIITG